MVGLGDFQDTTVSFPWLRLVSGRKNKSHLFVKPKRFLTGTIANKIMQTTDGGHIRNLLRCLQRAEVSLQLFRASLTYFALCHRRVLHISAMPEFANSICIALLVDVPEIIES